VSFDAASAMDVQYHGNARVATQGWRPGGDGDARFDSVNVEVGAVR
jgi:hypothetical protein